VPSLQGDARLLYVSEHVLRLRSTPTLKGYQVEAVNEIAAQFYCPPAQQTLS
jgi:hypothetical protein